MSAKGSLSLRWILLLAGLCQGLVLAEDAVNVTIEADRTDLFVGETTTVTVYGRIDAAIEADADQIFSWYIDVLNDNEVAASGYDNVETPTSDNHPDTSDDGIELGPNLRGIYDTFLFQPGAGKGERVILVQFEVTAHAAGTATFSVAPGTTVGPLEDFLVAQTGSGFFTGGNYTAASVAIEVSELDPAGFDLVVVRVGDMAFVAFTPVPGFDHSLQYSDSLQPGDWIDIAGGPYNEGQFNEVVSGVVRRFYRVGATPQ